MTDNEKTIINEAIRRNREIASQAILQIESLSALLPRQKKEKPEGYYTDPFGKRQYYDSAAKKRHERERRKLTLINKEAS